MERVHRETAPAKVNLTLDVRGTLPGGWHEVETVLTTISLHDTVELEWHPEDRPKTGEEIRCTCDRPDLPVGPDNLAVRAARCLRERAGIPGTIRLHLTKRIPVGAGLGGGSADAAAVLRLIDRVARLGLTTTQLEEIGAALGTDVPFCVRGGTAFAGHRGEIVEPLPSLPPLEILLVPGDVSVSTRAVYQAWRRSGTGGSHSRALRAVLESGHSPAPWELVSMFHNDLEEAAIRCVPAIGETMARIGRLGGIARMTGSGAAVMGFFPDAPARRQAREQLEQRGIRVRTVSTIHKNP